MSVSKNYDYSVFVNCPFDIRYRRLFRAIIFTIIDCGFTPRCSLELEDSSVERLDKLFKLISECKLGMHDISRTQLDSEYRLPRFNMPLELGMFLSAKHFGSSEQRKKNCLIIDTDRYRYQKFISDIGGKDIAAHGNDIDKVIKVIRNWLGTHIRELIPGARNISRKYSDFIYQLPGQCRVVHLEQKDLTFSDYMILAEMWLKKYDEEIGDI